jgi:N-acyl-D-aspartate/D-glutamate deacylase
VDVEFDIYPYQCGSTVLTQVLPQWTLDGGKAELLKRLRNSETRKKIWNEMKAKPRYWNDVTISSEPLAGKTVEELARLRGVDPETCAMDLLVEEDAAVNMVSFNQSEDNLRQLITHKLCSVITDGFYVRGKAHPRLYGTYPELLGKLVRERKWLSLSEAVHKSTGKPAARLNLADRGVLRVGNMADLVVFDAEKISSPATYDEPNVDPRGIVHVIKNGAVA